MRKLGTWSVLARHLDWLTVRGRGCSEGKRKGRKEERRSERKKEEGSKGGRDGKKEGGKDRWREGGTHYSSETVPHSGMTEHWFALAPMWMDIWCSGAPLKNVSF